MRQTNYGNQKANLGFQIRTEISLFPDFLFYSLNISTKKLKAGMMSLKDNPKPDLINVIVILDETSNAMKQQDFQLRKSMQWTYGNRNFVPLPPLFSNAF